MIGYEFEDIVYLHREEALEALNAVYESMKINYGAFFVHKKSKDCFVVSNRSGCYPPTYRTFGIEEVEVKE